MAEQPLEAWVVEYDNDTGSNDDCFYEFYRVGPAVIKIPSSVGRGSSIDSEKRAAQEKALADAHLMAAAPDLLAACKVALGLENDRRAGYLLEPADYAELYQSLFEAIAKAEGG